MTIDDSTATARASHDAPDGRDKRDGDDGNDGRNGHAFTQLLALALPTFGQLIAEPAFVMIDTAIVGHITGAALAGLSLGSTIVLTAVGLCVFLAYGTTSQVAQLMGAGKRKQGLEAGIDGLWLALGIGIIISAILFLFAQPLCRAMGAQGDVLINAVRYLRAIVFGLPGMLLVYAANGIFRGIKQVRITFIAASAGALVNTALDVLFVFGLNWGVAGSGFATLIAQWFMGIFLVVPALVWARKDDADWRPRLAGIFHTASDGVPLFIRTLALRASLVATVILAAHMSTQVLAAYQAVNATWNFVLNMLDAIGIAGQTLVATELGAGRRQRAKAMTTLAGKAGWISGIVIGIGMVVFGFVAAAAFSPSPSIQHLIMVGMVVQGVLLPLAGWMWALDGILIGARDYRYLAVTCTITAVIYLSALAGLNALDMTLNPSASVRMALLWLVLNVFFIGGRAIFNATRIRGEAWMHPSA